ncbi:hypothetical protein ADUPG1_001141, partial [Aduncisulcus paluster]
MIGGTHSGSAVRDSDFMLYQLWIVYQELRLMKPRIPLSLPLWKDEKRLQEYELLIAEEEKKERERREREERERREREERERREREERERREQKKERGEKERREKEKEEREREERWKKEFAEREEEELRRQIEEEERERRRKELEEEERRRREEEEMRRLEEERRRKEEAEREKSALLLYLPHGLSLSFLSNASQHDDVIRSLAGFGACTLRSDDSSVFTVTFSLSGIADSISEGVKVEEDAYLAFQG